MKPCKYALLKEICAHFCIYNLYKIETSKTLNCPNIFLPSQCHFFFFFLSFCVFKSCRSTEQKASSACNSRKLPWHQREMIDFCLSSNLVCKNIPQVQPGHTISEKMFQCYCSRYGWWWWWWWCSRGEYLNKYLNTPWKPAFLFMHEINWADITVWLILSRKSRSRLLWNVKVPTFRELLKKNSCIEWKLHNKELLWHLLFWRGKPY